MITASPQITYSIFYNIYAVTSIQKSLLPSNRRRLAFILEATLRIELRIEDLQSSALPLGYVAIKMERKTRLELATPTLAR